MHILLSWYILLPLKTLNIIVIDYVMNNLIVMKKDILEFIIKYPFEILVSTKYNSSNAQFSISVY